MYGTCRIMQLQVLFAFNEQMADVVVTGAPQCRFDVTTRSLAALVIQRMKG